MNEEKKEDEIEPLGESKNNMEEVVSKKKRKNTKKKAVKKKTTIKKTKNYTQTINLFLMVYIV